MADDAHRSVRTDLSSASQRVTRKPGAFWPSRAWLLLVLPLPLLAGAVVALSKGALGNLVANAASFVLLLYGAVLARQGLAEEAEYHRRKVARPPRVPRKTLAGLLTAAGTMIGAYFGASYSPVISACFGVGAFVGFAMFYGLDPRTEKVIQARRGVTTEEVIEAVAEAERSIAAIDRASREIRGRELTERLRRISALAKNIIDIIEDDPRDLRRARKFLHVYLEGAKRVSEGYARTHRHGTSEELEDNFRRVLVTIEDVFKEQHQKLLENNVLDLDVQIEVLSTQLEREGVA